MKRALFEGTKGCLSNFAFLAYIFLQVLALNKIISKLRLNPSSLCFFNAKNVEEKLRIMASSSVDVISVLVNVILRKSIYVYKEFALLMVDFLPVMVSTIRFSRFFFRPTTVVSARYSPMSSMVARHDR